MGSNSDNRPVEIHLKTVSKIDTDAMPLVTSMAFGERHVSKMLNMSNRGIVSPGIYEGFTVSKNSGLELRIGRDSKSGISVASVDIGNTSLRIFQQHDIILTLIPNAKNYIVVEGYYVDGVETSQINDDSLILPARVRRLLKTDVTEDQIIICSVDLTGEFGEINTSMIDYTERKSSSTDVKHHLEEDHPHVQYQKSDNIELSSVLPNFSVKRNHVIVEPGTYNLVPLENGSWFTASVSASQVIAGEEFRFNAPDNAKIKCIDAEADYVFFEEVNQVFRFEVVDGGWNVWKV